jgi:glycosyltransferase involved in cell wall biosynthesis
MHIAVDGRSLGSSLGGDETMLRGVLRGLTVVAPESDQLSIVLPTDASMPSGTEDRWHTWTEVRRPGPVHFVWTLPRRLRRGGPDVALSVTHAPVGAGSLPVALVVNDISFLRRPQDYPLVARVRLTQAVAAQVRRVALITTVSEFCRQDIIDAYGLDPERVRVIPNAVDPPLDLDEEAATAIERDLRKANVHPPFFVSLSNLHPRKNLVRLVRAFSAARREPSWPGHTLVVAGASWWGGAPEAPPEGVTYLGRVDDLTREYLLRRATGLAYVSLFEGFGLPPLEAMMRGTPVIASNVTAIPEVVGEAGLLVDPTSESDIADALLALACNPDLANRLAGQGREKAKTFSILATGRAAHAALVLASGR